MSVGYYDARSLKFIGNPQNALLEWLRFPGDVVFIVGGALPMLYICCVGLRYQGARRKAAGEPVDVLFTDVVAAGDVRDRL